MFEFRINFTQGICPQTISDYIAVGRSKVLGTSADPYRHIKSGKKLRAKMDADAAQIYRDFQNIEGRAAQEAEAKRIIALQHGPKVAPAFKRGQRVTYLAGGKVSRLEGVAGKWLLGTVKTVGPNGLTVLPDHRKLSTAAFKGMLAVVELDQVSPA